jgi:YggT family protein
VAENVDIGKTASVAVTEELIMSLIGALVGYALTAFILLLLARMVLDWSGVLASGPQWASRARELTHAWTEPVIAPVRRVLRPVRAGGLSIDLAFTAVFIAVLILRSIAFSL